MSFSLIYALTFTHTTAYLEIFSLIFETKKRWLCEKKSRRGNHIAYHIFLWFHSKLKKKIARVAVYVHVGKRKSK